MQNQDTNFQEYINTLPPELKQAIKSVDYAQKLQEIVKNNKLMIDQAGKLEAETTLVLAGIEPLDKYIKNLIDNVGLSNVQASVVAHDVNQLIFKNIRDALKKINEDIKKEEEILEEKEQTSTEENIQNKEPKKEEVHKEMSDMGIELRENTLPEIAPKIDVPMVSNTQKAVEPLHQNVSPIKNIVETKMTETVITPKKEIVIEEKTKLPEKKTSGDPYREPII